MCPKPISALFVTTLLIPACAGMGMNSVVKTQSLTVGMTQAQVTATLGVEPSGTVAKGGKTLVRYTLHQNWKGFVPYYMVFDPQGRLRAWGPNEAEYQANQKAMGEAFGVGEKKSTGSGGQGAAASAAPSAGPNNAALMQWIAGSYMSYKGQTHRRFILRPNGTFSLTRVSSYGGKAGQTGGSWGSASQSGDRGRWAISGSKAAGTITMSYTNGKRHLAKYRAGRERGVFLFDGVTFAYEGPAK